MTWHRGFLVCNDIEADAVEVALDKQARMCRLVQQGGETVFAFAARGMPQLEFRNLQYAGVDGSSISLVVGGDPHFRPRKLIIRVGYTVGLSLRTNDARGLPLRSSWELLYRSLGKSSEESIGGGQTTFRWDIDQSPLYSSNIDKVSRTLHAMADILDARKIEHHITAFDSGYSTVRGELEPSGDTFCGPDVYIRIDWIDSNGSPSFVSASTGEFMSDVDDLPAEYLGP